MPAELRNEAICHSVSFLFLVVSQNFSPVIQLSGSAFPLRNLLFIQKHATLPRSTETQFSTHVSLDLSLFLTAYLKFLSPRPFQRRFMYN